MEIELNEETIKSKKISKAHLKLASIFADITTPQQTISKAKAKQNRNISKQCLPMLSSYYPLYKKNPT